MRYGTLAISSLLLLSLVQVNAQTSPVTVSGVVHNQLTTPTTMPTVQVVGSCTGTNYQYEYVAVDAANGMTGPSPANSPAASGCSSFTASNFNIVTTPTINGASNCTVWRTAPTGSKGKVGTAPCGSAILDTTNTLDGSNPPGVNNTGSISAGGTVTALNFLATSGSSAGTSDWVTGTALPPCSTTQPQPCIQQNSFFISANSTLPATPFGWLSPMGPNTANSALIVGTPSGTGINSSTLSFASLSDSSNATPTIATVTGTLTGGDLVSLSSPSSGLYDFIDSGIALSSGKISTSSLTGVLPTANGGTGISSNFGAHQFFGNSAGSAASPSSFVLTTNDTSVNWYSAGGGTANVQTVTLPVTSPATLSLASGLEVHWLPTAANTTTTPTLNVNLLGAHTITKCGTAALVPNDLTTAAIARVVYDGSNFQLQNPQAETCGSVVPLCTGASVNITGGTTVYIAFGTNNTTETAAPMPVPVSGTAVSLHAWANANLPYSVAVTARYNGADLTNLSCSLSASSGATSCDNTTPGTGTISEGGSNRWDIKLSAGTGTGALTAYTACIKVVGAY